MTHVLLIVNSLSTALVVVGSQSNMAMERVGESEQIRMRQNAVPPEWICNTCITYILKLRGLLYDMEVLLKQLAPELFVIVSLSCDDIMNRRRASALNSLLKHGMQLKHLDDWCVHDHELVLMAVQQYDHELVVMAVQQNGLVF